MEVGTYALPSYIAMNEKGLFWGGSGSWVACESYLGLALKAAESGCWAFH